MKIIIILFQIIIASSVFIVWIFRNDNISQEFKQYSLSSLTKNLVGAIKISLSTILILAIWYTELLFFSAVLMAFLMLCAQYFHFKVNNPIHKFLPSLFLFIISLFLALTKIL